jgi:DNA-binding TFAR19-related protein (PDSD5 family)
MIDEALETMSVPISSINHIKVIITDENNFKILERLSNRAKRVELSFRRIIEDIYEPN